VPLPAPPVHGIEVLGWTQCRIKSEVYSFGGWLVCADSLLYGVRVKACQGLHCFPYGRGLCSPEVGEATEFGATCSPSSTSRRTFCAVPMLQPLARVRKKQYSYVDCRRMGGDFGLHCVIRGPFPSPQELMLWRFEVHPCIIDYYPCIIDFPLHLDCFGQSKRLHSIPTETVHLPLHSQAPFTQPFWRSF